MRAVIGIILVLFGLTAMAQEEIIAQGTDKGPKVEMKLPEKPQTPLIQNYRTDEGKIAAVITPEEGNQYFFVQVQDAYQTQYPQDREADVPINESGWTLFGW